MSVTPMQLPLHFERGMKGPREKHLAKFTAAIRQQTKRTRPGSMKQSMEASNRTLRGWINYFKPSLWNIFPDLDKWVRGRLRTILRQRHKGKGRARGKEHQRWPNAYFAELGLISLALTRAQAANAPQEAH